MYLYFGRNKFRINILRGAMPTKPCRIRDMRPKYPRGGPPSKGSPAEMQGKPRFMQTCNRRMLSPKYTIDSHRLKLFRPKPHRSGHFAPVKQEEKD
jgi:hypothetical protein